MAKPTPKSYGNSKLLRPLTPKGLRREVRAQVAVQYNPQQRQIRQEQQAAQLQSRRIRAYFPQYLHTIHQTQVATKNAYNRANQQDKNATNAATDYAEQLRQRLQSEGAQSAALRGVGYNPSQDLTDAQGQLARIASGNTLRGVTAAQGASQKAYLSDQKRIGRREMIDALQQQSARERTYNSDLENLARERGQAAAAARNTLRGQEQQFYLGLLSAHNSRANALLSARTSAENSRRSAATSRADSRRAARTSRQNSIRTQRHEDRRAQNSSSSSSNPGVRKALADLRTYATQHPHGSGALTSRQSAIDYLIHEGYSRKVAGRAVKRALGANNPFPNWSGGWTP